jgi:VWFA-related protein
MRRLSLVTVVVAGLSFTGAWPVAAQSSNRSVYVSVNDDDGKGVPDLTAADFEIKEGGRDRAILSVEPARARMRMAILVEESLTPTGGVRIGLAEFIRRMQPHAEMALVVVGLRNTTIVDYTTDVGALFAGINSFSRNSHQQSNNVPEGVYEAAKKFEQERPERPVIVVVAQELMQASSENPQNVLNQIRRSGALVQVVTVEAGSFNVAVGSLNEMSGRAQVLGDGSKQSGGERIEVTALTGVSRALQQVADRLTNQYRITYELPPGVKPSERLEVDIKRSGLTMRAPTRISANIADPR